MLFLWSVMNKAPHFIFLFLLSIVCAPNGFAQTNKPTKQLASLIGNLQDGVSGKPIIGARVSLTLKPDSALAIVNKPQPKLYLSDKNGSFNFDQLPYGYYLLNIQSLGYAHYTLDSIWLRAEKDELVLNDILLKDSSSTLAEVIVYADKKLIEDKDGVLTYNVSESPISNGSNASDILKNMPLINANPDGTLSVKGKTPLILIDEKPTNLNAQQLADLLESLPANVIEKVELMQTPPPEYATYDGSVINIVSKKDRIGFSQRYAISGGTKGETSLSSNINYKSPKLSFASNIGVGSSRSFGNSWSHRQNTYTDSVNYFYNESDYLNKNWHPNIRLQADYDFDKRHTVGLVYQGNTNYLDNTSNTMYTNLDSAFRVWKASSRTVDYTGTSYSHGLTGSYVWKGINGGEKLQIYSGINFGKNQNGKDFFQQFLLQDFLPSGVDSSQNQQSDNFSTSYYLRVNYAKPFTASGKKIFTTGVSFTQNDEHNIVNYNLFNKADSAFYQNNLWSNDFFFYQGIATARAGGVFIFEKGWRINIGAQAEFTNDVFKFIKGTAVDANNQYWRVLPNATIRKEFSSKLNMSFTIKQSIRRPGIKELNPSTDFSDPYNIRFGNPYVKPALTNNLDFSISYATKGMNLNASGGYSKVKDVFSSVRTLVSAGKTQTTYLNISDQDEFHVSVWSGITITRKFKLNVSSGLNVNRYSAIDKLLYKYRDGSSYYVGLNYSYMPNNLTTFEASNKYNNVSNPQGKAHSNISMTLSAQRKLFNKRVVLSFAAVDPLGLTKYTGITEGKNFVVNSYSVSNTKNFRLTISYQLNKSYINKKPGSQKELDKLKVNPLVP